MRIESCMKLWIGFFDGKYADAERHDRIHCKHQPIRRKMMVPIKMRNLSERMHPAVGSSCSGYIAMFSANLFQTFFYDRLHGGFFALNLPAVKVCAVICDPCFQPRH